MKVVVKRHHDRSFADSQQFVVNGDYDHPVCLLRAVTRAKTEALDALFNNGIPNSYITSSETGEILFALGYSKDLSLTFCGPMQLTAMVWRA